MTLVSRIPELQVSSSLAIQRAVEEAGQELEYLALQRVQARRRTGREVAKMKWKPDRGGFSGVMGAGTFYTRFSEYGTVFQAARPILGPVAEEVRPHYEGDIAKAYMVP